jgi:hypothetical protein
MNYEGFTLWFDKVLDVYVGEWGHEEHAVTPKKIFHIFLWIC